LKVYLPTVYFLRGCRASSQKTLLPSRREESQRLFLITKLIRILRYINERYQSCNSGLYIMQVYKYLSHIHKYLKNRISSHIPLCIRYSSTQKTISLPHLTEISVVELFISNIIWFTPPFIFQLFLLYSPIKIWAMLIY